MSELSATTEALAAAVAAAVSKPEQSMLAGGLVEGPITSAGTAPFPKLEPEQGLAADPITAAATAAAISTAMAGAVHLRSGSMGGGDVVPVPLGTTVGVAPSMTTMAATDDSVLASLQRNPHEQMMEIMGTYQTAHAHRRRSSVEAAAAASSVLASIASSTKPYMGGEVAAAAAMAAAAAAAVNAPSSMSQIGAYSTQTATQSSAAAAALLAASTMHPVMLPTIPSGSVSLRGTPPPPSQSANGDTSMAAFSASAFATLSPQSFSAAEQIVASAQPFSPTEQITASIAATSIEMSAPLVTPQSSGTTGVAIPAFSGAMEVDPNGPRGHRRKSEGGQPDVGQRSSDDEDRDADDDDLLGPGGMPLTPDAPGSGRPGSLRHLTADERRARRLQRNRLAAKECRQKKKAYIQNLEETVAGLQEENERLRKDVEELNAKLTLGGMRVNSSSATTPVLDPKQLGRDASADVGSSPPLASKRPRISVRSTSTAKLPYTED